MSKSCICYSFFVYLDLVIQMKRGLDNGCYRNHERKT